MRRQLSRKLFSHSRGETRCWGSVDMLNTYIHSNKVATAKAIHVNFHDYSYIISQESRSLGCVMETKLRVPVDNSFDVVFVYMYLARQSMNIKFSPSLIWHRQWMGIRMDDVEKHKGHYLDASGCVDVSHSEVICWHDPPHHETTLCETHQICISIDWH